MPFNTELRRIFRAIIVISIVDQNYYLGQGFPHRLSNQIRIDKQNREYNDLLCRSWLFKSNNKVHNKQHVLTITMSLSDCRFMGQSMTNHGCSTSILSYQDILWRIPKLKSHIFTCCRTEAERRDHDFYFSRPHYTGTGPISRDRTHDF